MSLYSRLFNENPETDLLLGMIGMKREDFGRFRDIYPSANGEEIIVYTRCGGFNRHQWQDLYDILKKCPFYDRDYDDEWDSTYSYIVFKTPNVHVLTCKLMADGKEPLTVKEKFDKEIEEMRIPGSEAEKRAKEIAKELQEKIENSPNGGAIFL